MFLILQWNQASIILIGFGVNQNPPPPEWNWSCLNWVRRTELGNFRKLYPLVSAFSFTYQFIWHSDVTVSLWLIGPHHVQWKKREWYDLILVSPIQVIDCYTAVLALPIISSLLWVWLGHGNCSLHFLVEVRNSYPRDSFQEFQNNRENEPLPLGRVCLRHGIISVLSV